MAQIATESGVSISTVSRILADGGNFSTPTRERVLRAAEQLGYRMSPAAGGRPSNRVRAIELVLGDNHDSWTAEVVRGAWEAANRLKLDLVLTLERADISEDWPERVVARRSWGVVVGLICPTATQTARLDGLRIPFVLVDPRSNGTADAISVGTTDWEGGFSAGEHLALRGYRRFVTIAGTPAYRFGRRRLAGFQDAVSRFAPQSDCVHLSVEWSDRRPLFHELEEALRGDEPVGVFAMNDDIAFVAWRVARALGLSVPHDVGIVGFDNEARSESEGLTTVHQPIAAIAGRAVEIVNAIRLGDQPRSHREELPSHLIARSSTGRL